MGVCVKPAVEKAVACCLSPVHGITDIQKPFRTRLEELFHQGNHNLIHMAVGFCMYIGIKALLIDSMFVEKRVFDEGDVIGSTLLGDKEKRS